MRLLMIASILLALTTTSQAETYRWEKKTISVKQLDSTARSAELSDLGNGQFAILYRMFPPSMPGIRYGIRLAEISADGKPIGIAKTIFNSRQYPPGELDGNRAMISTAGGYIITYRNGGRQVFERYEPSLRLIKQNSNSYFSDASSLWLSEGTGSSLLTYRKGSHSVIRSLDHESLSLSEPIRLDGVFSDSALPNGGWIAPTGDGRVAVASRPVPIIPGLYVWMTAQIRLYDLASRKLLKTIASINQTSTQTLVSHRIASTGTGFLAAYTVHNGDNMHSVKIQAFTSDGVKIGAERTIYSFEAKIIVTSMVPLSDDRIVVEFEREGQRYIQVVDARARTVVQRHSVKFDRFRCNIDQISATQFSCFEYAPTRPQFHLYTMTER